MKKEGIVQRLFELRAESYAGMQHKIIPFIEEKKLDVWMRDEAIQKIVESRRIRIGERI